MGADAVRSDVPLTEQEALRHLDLPAAPGAPGEGQGVGVLTVPAALEAALKNPPVSEKRLLEIGLSWLELSAEQAWAAERLRVFLLTWDPFEWEADRPAAFATSSTRRDGPGLVLYLPYWQAGVLAGGQVAALPSVLGRLGESVLSVAAEQRSAIVDGSYPARVAAGSAPALLSRVRDEPLLAPPELSVSGAGWRPIQFDVLEDLAQEGFGPADLDRSPVRFSDPGAGTRDGAGAAVGPCPGCAGAAVDFPEGLEGAQASLCGPHRAEALRVTTARLEAAKASNPAGWEALVDAGQRLSEPHIPNGMGPRLVAASQVPAPTAPELREQATLVDTAAKVVGGLPDPDTPLGARVAPVRPWLEGLPGAMTAAGLDDLVPGVTAAVATLLGRGEPEVSETPADEAPPKPQPYRREVRVGRNAPCPCGSGKKYKFCHGVGGRSR